MPAEEIVAQPNGQNQPAENQPAQQPQNPPQNTPAQRPGAEDQSGKWERERAGLLADLNKERKARQEHERRVQELTGTLTTEQKRVRALAGLEVKSEQQQELDQVRERLVQMFPVLAKLTDEKVDEVLAAMQEVGSVREVTQSHWTRHGQSMLDNLAENVADGIGKDLTDRQKKQLFRAYVAEAEANPEFLKRHEAGDPKLIEEFAKDFISDWFETARRQVVNDEVSRRPRVPNGRDRSVTTGAPKKIDFKNEKAIEDAMVESFKANGGRFGA